MQEKMTIKRLEQYTKIASEIASLERRMNELLQEKDLIIADTVQGSSPSFPYIQHTITVKGADSESLRTIRRIHERLAARRTRLYQEQEAIEKYIDGLEDSTVKMIIQFRYVKGWSWNRVAREVYGHADKSAPRKKLERHFRKEQ